MAPSTLSHCPTRQRDLGPCSPLSLMPFAGGHLTLSKPTHLSITQPHTTTISTQPVEKLSPSKVRTRPNPPALMWREGCGLTQFCPSDSLTTRPHCPGPQAQPALLSRWCRGVTGVCQAVSCEGSGRRGWLRGEGQPLPFMCVSSLHISQGRGAELPESTSPPSEVARKLPHLRGPSWPLSSAAERDVRLTLDLQSIRSGFKQGVGVRSVCCSTAFIPLAGTLLLLCSWQDALSCEGAKAA